MVDFKWHRWFDMYPKAESRMVVNLQGCSDVSIEGLTLRDSGGDGIIVAWRAQSQMVLEYRIKDVLCDNNYRQGMSIISCDGLTVEHCQFNNTWGTPPLCGVDRTRRAERAGREYRLSSL